MNKQELLERLDLLLNKLNQYPNCEHIAKEVDNVLEILEELENE